MLQRRSGHICPGSRHRCCLCVGERQCGAAAPCCANGHAQQTSRFHVRPTRSIHGRHSSATSDHCHCDEGVGLWRLLDHEWHPAAGLPHPDAVPGTDFPAPLSRPPPAAQCSRSDFTARIATKTAPRWRDRWENPLPDLPEGLCWRTRAEAPGRLQGIACDAPTGGTHAVPCVCPRAYGQRQGQGRASMAKVMPHGSVQGDESTRRCRRRPANKFSPIQKPSHCI